MANAAMGNVGECRRQKAITLKICSKRFTRYEPKFSGMLVLDYKLQLQLMILAGDSNYQANRTDKEFKAIIRIAQNIERLS